MAGWTVTVYTKMPKAKGELFDDFHCAERRGKEYHFEDQASANRFAQSQVEVGKAWMVKVNITWEDQTTSDIRIDDASGKRLVKELARKRPEVVCKCGPSHACGGCNGSRN